MPPKLKGGTENKKNAANCNVDNDLSLALRRPRRENKAFEAALREEEDAQLELAIKLSLKAQRAEKKKLANTNKLKTVIKSKAVSKTSPSKSNGTDLKEPSEPSAESQTASPSSTKPHCSSKFADKQAKRQHTVSTMRARPKKLKMEDLDIEKCLKMEEIPSTASFLTYVLQKGSRNRDMHLVKQFERQESQEEESSCVTNPATESESDLDHG